MIRTAFLALLLCFSWNASASETPPPPNLDYILAAHANTKAKPKDNEVPSLRLEALKNAALSYGARAGLARKTYEIRQELRHKEHFLDQTYNFNQLLIRGPSGVFIEPPIISEAQDNLLIEADGQSAAVSELLLQINKNAKIVSAARNWRSYLERDWGAVEAPPEVLWPRDDEERAIWLSRIKEGWEQGYLQGEEVFQANLDRLSAHFEGMVRYRMLLQQNIVTPPFAMLEERGVTGGGDELRIGDRAVAITGPSQLQNRPEEWQPAGR